MLLCDNQDALKLVKYLVLHARTKHIELQHQFIWKKIQEGAIDVMYVPNVEQHANVLTKPLGRLRFVEL